MYLGIIRKKRKEGEK